MIKSGRLEDHAFANDEDLYRRCHPEHVDEYEHGKFRVLPEAWTDLHNMSVVRGKYAHPDHARWDSATDPENPTNFVPQLYREWHVVRVAVGEIPQPMATEAVTYSFVPRHVPFDDLYSHSEIRARKNGVEIKQQNKFKSETVKAQYRAALSNAAAVVLKPHEVDPPEP
jgi:hypothetical protein